MARIDPLKTICRAFNQNHSNLKAEIDTRGVGIYVHQLVGPEVKEYWECVLHLYVASGVFTHMVGYTGDISSAINGGVVLLEAYREETACNTLW